MQSGKKLVCNVGRVYLVVIMLLLIPAGAMAGIQLNFEWDCVLPDSTWGFVNLECDCEPFSNAWDCPELQANIGDPCQTATGPGTVNEDCECEE